MAKRHRKVKVLVVSPPIFAAQPRPQKHPLPQEKRAPRLNYTLGISISALVIALFEGHGFRIVNKFCFATDICGNGKIPVIVNRVRVEQLPGKIQMDQIVLNTIVINHDEREVMITRAGLYASSTTKKSNVTSLMNGATDITIPPNSTVSLEIRSVKLPRPLSCRETEVNHLHLEIRAVDGDGNIMGAGGAIGKIVRTRSGKFIATLGAGLVDELECFVRNRCAILQNQRDSALVSFAVTIIVDAVAAVLTTGLTNLALARDAAISRTRLAVGVTSSNSRRENAALQLVATVDSAGVSVVARGGLLLANAQSAGIRLSARVPVIATRGIGRA